jgi:hypothetical protein
MSLLLVEASASGFRPLLTADLQALQAEQFHHDENYHREIARLSVQDRLRHMTLHFSKYVGRLLEDSATNEKTITDIFVIALSSANILGIHLNREPKTNRAPACSTESDYIQRLAIVTGKMAAACEKLDHLEDFPFRAVLRESTIEITKYTMDYACAIQLDLRGLVRERLKGVRGKAYIPGQSQ